MKKADWRPLALLLAGAFIGILGNIIVSVLIGQICLNNKIVSPILVILFVISTILLLFGSGYLDLKQLFNVGWRKYSPKVGILNDIGWLFSVKNTRKLDEELNTGTLPKKLKNKIKKKDTMPSENITVEKEKEDCWRIIIEDKIYIAKKWDKKLNLYDIKDKDIDTDILPEDWGKNIKDCVKSEGKNVRVELINTKKNFDPFIAILNPYAEAYPESDLKNFDTLYKIFNYVLAGGLFVNVADIFGYCAYNALLKPGRRIDTPPPVYGIKYATDGSIERLESAKPFERTPAMEMLGLRVSNTEDKKRGPVQWNIEFEDEFKGQLGQGKCGIKVHRAVIVEKNVESIVKPQLQSGEEITPLCFVNYGNEGKFLLSLFWISKQEKEIREWLKTVISRLVVNSVKNRS